MFRKLTGLSLILVSCLGASVAAQTQETTDSSPRHVVRFDASTYTGLDIPAYSNGRAQKPTDSGDGSGETEYDRLIKTYLRLFVNRNLRLKR